MSLMFYLCCEVVDVSIDQGPQCGTPYLLTIQKVLLQFDDEM